MSRVDAVEAAIAMIEELGVAGLKVLLQIYRATYAGTREARLHDVYAAGASPSSFFAVIRKLTAHGLVERLYKESPRRGIISVKLTERGKRLAEAIVSTVAF